MGWVFEQITGDLYHDGVFVGTGYSGHGKTFKEGRNNPKKQSIKGVGPCPAGKFRIGHAHKSDKVGPVAMNVEPCKGTEMFGRSDIMIHGDNKANDASRGCLIFARSIRDQIARSRDRDLTVIKNIKDLPPPKPDEFE